MGIKHRVKTSNVETNKRAANMPKGFFLAVGMLMTSLSLVASDCPPQQTEVNGRCSLHVHCRGTIDDIMLPARCQGSPNYPVRIEVTLTDAIDKYEENITNPEFMSAIVTLHVSGNLPKTSLAFIEDMHSLERLHLVNDKIEQVEGKPFYFLERLEEVDLSYNSLTDIGDLFSFEAPDNKLKVLSLAFNQIDNLPSTAFEELSSLVELDLSNNRLSDLTVEPFSNLTNLETLRLNNNRIKDLNGAVNKLVKLKHLFLKDNQLQNIDAESLQIIYHLETFDVSENDLTTLKPTVFMRHWRHFAEQQYSICKIILSGNHIQSIPNVTNNEMTKRFTRHLANSNELNYLDPSKDSLPHKVIVHTELDVSKNKILYVEFDAFQTIEHLTTLDLSNNKLNNFIINPKDLADMKLLNLSCNSITTLFFDSFASMTNLQNLDLSHNQLELIPDRTLLNNYNLKYVNMTFNKLRELNNFHMMHFHPEGGVLDLSNNGLFQLHLPMHATMRLMTLILTSNNIKDVTSIILSDQRNLKTLYLSENHISELDSGSLRLPIGLAYLDFRFNRISKIGDGTFHRVAHLQTLRLSHNNLAKVSCGTFSGLRELKNLDLSNNNIHFLDSKVLSDLRDLRVLSLSFNQMTQLDYNGWLGNKIGPQVFLDGNNITCEWLSVALRDYYSGYSKMRPSVLSLSTSASTLEGIPCVSGDGVSQRIRDGSYTGTDERLLINSQKILEAIGEQTYFLRKFLWQTFQNDRKPGQV